MGGFMGILFYFRSHGLSIKGFIEGLSSKMSSKMSLSTNIKRVN